MLLCRLVRLMTRGDTCQLAAELLFVLCKERVNRLVKYTGYGNAAGLLASKGLLLLGGAGGRGGGAGGAQYSSDSEDSDTEEYARQRPHVNPVLGCYQPPGGPHPLAGMSQEQKEHEAMELANLIDRLARGGDGASLRAWGPMAGHTRLSTCWSCEEDIESD
ncbi:hypothetical protein HPB48_006288 [Haemaphysalis longicornis]|uniref:Uncharacterized protein n=1 Tax=Haemaphysalis longicornis TaxID=44386 RepID=A0A9J6GBZ0_HAELO|nr:hypothetical protein HPB48_006288 [Haemaphysalis longicornis]